MYRSNQVVCHYLCSFVFNRLSRPLVNRRFFTSMWGKDNVTHYPMTRLSIPEIEIVNIVCIAVACAALLNMEGPAFQFPRMYFWPDPKGRLNIFYSHFQKVKGGDVERTVVTVRWSKPHLTLTYNAAGVSRRQHQNLTHFVKNVNILEFGYYIWNPYENAFKRVHTCLVLVH